MNTLKLLGPSFEQRTQSTYVHLSVSGHNQRIFIVSNILYLLWVFHSMKICSKSCLIDFIQYNCNNNPPSSTKMFCTKIQLIVAFSYYYLQQRRTCFSWILEFAQLNSFPRGSRRCSSYRRVLYRVFTRNTYGLLAEIYVRLFMQSQQQYWGPVP